MRKVLKITMIVFMLLGILLSVSNFLLVELTASAPSEEGAWQQCPDGGWKCIGDGDCN